jgi:hypothetical protein
VGTLRDAAQALQDRKDVGRPRPPAIRWSTTPSCGSWPPASRSTSTRSTASPRSSPDYTLESVGDQAQRGEPVPHARRPPRRRVRRGRPHHGARARPASDGRGAAAALLLVRPPALTPHHRERLPIVGRRPRRQAAPLQLHGRPRTAGGPPCRVGPTTPAASSPKPRSRARSAASPSSTDGAATTPAIPAARRAGSPIGFGSASTPPSPSSSSSSSRPTGAAPSPDRANGSRSSAPSPTASPPTSTPSRRNQGMAITFPQPRVEVHLWRPQDFDAIHARLARGRRRVEPVG